MGILDGYQFDPSSYGGGPPGWLGLLLGAQPGQSQGFSGAGSPMASMGGAAGYGAGADQPPQMSQGAALPPMAAPAQGQGMPGPQMVVAPQAAPAASQGPGMLDRLSAGATNFTTGGNPLAGIINMIGGLATGQRTDPAGIMQQQQIATYRALIGAGIPPAVAQAAALNPEVMKTIAPQLYSKPEFKTIKNALGEDIPIFANADKQTITYPGTAGAQGGAPNVGMMQQTFDQIEAARNAGIPQQQLLQAVPNSLREGVGALLRGGAVPSNLSNRGQARDLALRFAHAIDPGFDETLIPQRVAFAHGMAQTTPNSIGGQKILLNTAIQHASELADRFIDLHNTNGVLQSVPGSQYLANIYNTAANSASTMGTTTNAINDISQKLAGEVGKLYSGASGGGEAERQATAGRFSVSNTPNQTIGGLEATRNLILDKLNSLQNQRDQVYGASGENIHPLVDKQTQVALQKIDAAIGALRGGQSGAAAPQGTDALTQARDAIARGAPREAVIQRLRQSGINPSGL